MKLLCLILGASLITGCASANRYQNTDNKKVITTRYGVKIHIYNADSEQLSLIEKQVGMMTEKCQRSIRLFRFINRADNSHFKAETEAAHCESDGAICINGNAFNPFDINHEAAHALTYRLPTSVVREWEDIAGPVYGDNHYCFGDLYPTDGLLTHYASRNAWEDIAVWVENLYKIADTNKPGLLRLIDTDARYRKKFEFLLKWGYIDQNVYDEIKPLLN